MSEHAFDVIVVGAGPAGEVAAGHLAERGKRVALVERHLVGGECSFYACMPSKALLRPAEVLEEAARVPGAAQAITGRLDVQATLDRRDEVIHNLSDESQLPWLKERSIALFRERARLEGERRVRVGQDVLEARDAVVLAVGSGALMPPIPGLAEAGAWSNREITTAREAPESLVVLGGGVVGVEMAQAWASLGTRVSIVEGLERLIAREEPPASAELADALRNDGIEIRTGQKATAVTHDESGISVTLEDDSRLTGRRLLVAIGRKPHTADLGLETLGIDPAGYIEVDDHMRVPGHDWLYAVGDVNGRSLLTHSGKYQARVATENILGGALTARGDRGDAPRVIFTRPQIAAVGQTLAAARESGRHVHAVDVQTSANAGASFHGRNAAGTSRFVVDTERQVLVGVTFVGPEVAEFLHAATIAVSAQVPLSALAHAVAPFPTRSEVWLKFLEAYERDRGLSVYR
ncbi:MAG TPA: NAD(P)/FAD-dependent oxidoreductase [Solirubrobacteraceae bacterium]|nr:NAD(P)/FAD-dependent oxidoreductase [Solirubrobacteraceae bacterium]